MKVKEFRFTLLFDIDDSLRDDWIERLAAAGCTDVLALSGIPGRLALNFVREAASIEEAIASAMAEVLFAIPEATQHVSADDGSQVATGSAHITPVGGNVFADRGFEQEESAALQSKAQQAIERKLEKMARKEMVCRRVSAARRYLEDARNPHISAIAKNSLAFSAGYLCLLDAAIRAGASIPHPHPDDPLELAVIEGAAELRLSLDDATFALVLWRWSIDRYLNPLRRAPSSAKAIEWARRVLDAAEARL